MSMMATPLHIANGFRRFFSYTVHPTLLAIQKRQVETGGALMQAAQKHMATWAITYSDIPVADPIVKAELASLKPGYANCMILDVQHLTGSFNGSFDEETVRLVWGR